MTLYENVAQVGDSAFARSGVTGLEIRNADTAVGASAFRDCSALTEIVYGGTMEEWNAMQKASDWDYSLDAYTIRCVDGDITK